MNKINNIEHFLKGFFATKFCTCVWTIEDWKIFIKFIKEYLNEYQIKLFAKKIDDIVYTPGFINDVSKIDDPFVRRPEQCISREKIEKIFEDILKNI